MADGNLGSLWFQLGLKDNTSKELQKIIDKLKTGDDAANALLRALQGFGTKKSGFKEQAEKAKEFSDVLLELNRRISKLRKNDKGDEAKDLQNAVKNALSYLDMLQKINIERSKISELRSLNPNVDTSKLREAEVMLENVNSQLLRLQGKPQGGGGGGVDQANVLQDYSKVLQMTLRDVKQITDQFKKENPLSAFSGGAAKVEADIARVTEKLAKMRDLMSEGVTKGYNTSMLGGSLTELDKVLSRLQAASGNKSILTDAAQMKNLLSDVAVEMTKATSATQAYGREKGKVIAIEREFAAAAKLSAKDNEAELKAQSDYIKRYMALVEKKREMAEKGGITLFQKNDQGLKNITAEIDVLLDKLSKVREDITLYQHAIGNGTKESIAFGQQGLKEANAEAEKLMSTITALQNVYDTLRVSQANVKDLIGQTPQMQRQNDIQKRMSEYYSNLEKTSAKEAAQATRDAAKAKREDAQADKQRQKEIEISTQRINSLSDALDRLKSARFTAKMLGIDTNEIDQQIYKVIDSINLLDTVRKRLESGDKTVIGTIGQIGNGREVQLANRVASEYERSNKEVQKSIELEQKRQAEIAKSAAKARNDLAAAFAGANAEAKKMQSIVSDIKSLFLQGGIVFGAQQFFNSIVQTGGEIVQQHVALRSILGDVQKADELFAQTQQLALQSPFKFGELNRDVKQLAAFCVEANDLYDTTKRLADIASGLGVSFERLGLAYGQVKARSWLDGKELRQFAYAGLPLLQKITDLYNQEGKNGRNNYTQADVKKMISGRQVSFEDVQKVLWNMTNEGGQFYNMQLVLSETLLGRWNKLIDAWDIMLGKFAEGKNVVGGTFSFIINRVTDLVLALDKLSPALLSFGAVFAAKKLVGFGSSKLGLGSLSKNYNDQVNAQLKAYAIEQQQIVVEGKITQQKALQNVYQRAASLTEKESLVSGYNRAALEGRMSILQMQRAVKEGLVSKEIIQQLALMGQITAKQEQIILNGGRISAVWSMTTSKVGGFINAIGGWWGIGITAVTSLLMGYNQWSDRVKEDEKTMVDGARQKSKSYGDFLSGLGPKSDSNMSSQVDSMKEILKSSDDYTDSIKEQVENADSLSKQYDILKKKIESVKDTNDKMAGKYGAVVNNATYATGLTNDNLFNALGIDTPEWLQWLNGLTNDDITKNVEEAQNSLSKFQVMFDELDSKTKVEMEDFIKSLMKNNQELANQIKGLPLAEQIRMLAAIGGDDWDKFVDKFVNGSKETENWLKELASRAKESSDDVSEIMYDDVPKGLESIRKQLGMSQDQFKEWAKKNPEIFANMMDKMAQKANITSKTILYYFHSAISKLMDMDFWPGDTDGKKKGKPTYNSGVNTFFAYTIRKRLFKNGTVTGTKKKGKFWASEIDNALRSVQDQSSYTTGENIQKELKSARNELDVLNTGKVNKKSSEYRNAKHKYDMWKAIADAGHISNDVGKNKVTGNFGKDHNKGGRKEDTELKNLQERLNSLKSARQMYQKYQTIMSDDEAKEKTLKLFPEVTGLNLNDYQKAVRELLKGFKINTSERKKFQTSIYREVAEWIFSEKDKKAFDEKAATFNEEMNKLSERWDLYKTLLEKTGNKNFAESSWIDAFQMDEKTKSLMDEWYAHYGEVFNLEDSLKLTDGQAKERFKKADQYNEWKKIVDLLRGNYVKSLQDGAEAISQTMAIAQKLDVIANKYNEKRKNAGDDQGLIDRYNYLEKQEKSGVLFDQLKSEINWDGVFGNLDNYTKKELRKIRKQIRDLVAGGILDGMSTTDLKSFYDGMEKLNQAIDGQGFSGLSDLIREMVDASQKYDDSVKEYNEAVEKYGKNSWQAEAARKKMQEAEDRKRRANGSVRTKRETRLSNILTVVDMFKTLGMSNGSGSTFLSNAGGWTESLMKMFGGDKAQKNSQKIGSIVGMFAGLTEAINEKGFGGFLSDAFEDIGGATNSIFKDLFGLNLGIKGADYSDYNKAKAEYENLVNIWDTLISKKKTYMSEHWGTEAQNASKEAMALLKSEIEQAKVIAKNRLGSGASIGSHSISYRMWKGSYDYNGTNWRDVAGEISSKYGVQFNGMEDMLNMAPKVLEGIKTDFSGLWANMDSDFRDYLDKLIEYGDQVDEMEESLTEKLTGNKFSDLVSSWGDAMSSMANSSDNLVDHFEDNLKKIILNSMIEDMYKDDINAILAKAKKYGDKDLSDNIMQDGKIVSTFTGEEYSDVMSDVDDVAKRIEATRDFLKKTYEWSDSSSSSSTNSVKGITEETADIIVSYISAMRLDLSVNRSELKTLSDFIQAKIPELSVIAQSQLTQLSRISQNTLRNADSAERIESMLNSVINGVKRVRVV